MAPNIGDSIKGVVEGAAEVVENAVGKLTGHSHEDTEDAATTPPSEHVVVETAAVSEPLEFERVDTDGTTKKLTFEPAGGATDASHPGTAE